MTHAQLPILHHEDSLDIRICKHNPIAPDFNWGDITAYELGHALWTDAFAGYEGYASLRVAAASDQLTLLFLVHEPENSWPPRAVAELDGDSVYEDSAVEFFFRPKGHSENYINIEMNSKGVILTAIGPNRNERQSLESDLRGDLTIRTFTYMDTGEKSESEYYPNGITRSERSWGLLLSIPSSVIGRFGLSSDEFSDNLEWEGNAYKCGDKTAVPHYRSLFPVRSAEPNYHRPQDFGTIRFLT